MDSVIVDLAKPPTGGLNGFNIHVALSCSRGGDTDTVTDDAVTSARMLRDEKQ
jgi:hypothetical protein